MPDGIDRRDQEYTVTVSWDYQGPPRLAGEYERQVFEAFRPPPGFSVDRDDEYFVTEDESRMLALAVAGAMLVMFLVLAVLYESLWHPFIVLATIPLALVGVSYLYLWTGASFTSSGYIGVILLVGIVDNNGVLLLDRISQLRRAGRPALAAATQGTLDRVRPVLLTSATTALGLLPMLWNEPQGGQPGLWSDLARSALGGLVTSSVLVLAVVPSLYMGGRTRPSLAASHGRPTRTPVGRADRLRSPTTNVRHRCKRRTPRTSPRFRRRTCRASGRDVCRPSCSEPKSRILQALLPDLTITNVYDSGG